MNRGTTVYRAVVYSAITDFDAPYYVQQAVATGVVVDGREMVRLYDLLLPADDGWHSTECEAKAAARLEIVRRIGQLQKVADEVVA
jgi:hypothetical protein